jgi:hypothetical protein
MSFDFWHLFHKQRPLVYKIWLENDGKPIPHEYLHYLNRRKLQGGKVVLWSSQAETNGLLAKYRDKFPRIYDLFWAKYTSPVMRSDILRLLLIYDQTGIYSDHDIEWSRRRLPVGYDFIAWTEFVNSDEAVRKNMAMTREFRGDVPEFNVRIANYVFGSWKPNSPILGRCLHRVQERLQRNSNAPLSQYGVLYTTGPDVMTDTLVEGLPDLSTLKPFEKCAHSNVEWTDRDGERVLLLGRQPGKAIARHEIHGAWRAAHPQK